MLPASVTRHEPDAGDEGVEQARVGRWPVMDVTLLKSRGGGRRKPTHA
jgi:hypothetical protein